MELTELKGIGSKTEEALKKAGIHDVMDLLFLFPRDYELYTPPLAISGTGYRPFAVIKGVFFEEPKERRAGKLRITQAVLKDEAGDSIRAVWFNAPFIKNAVRTGIPYVLRGRISRKYGVRQIDQPKMFLLGEYDRLEGSMQPVYPLSKGVTNQLLKKAIANALESRDFLKLDEDEFIPYSIRKTYGLMNRSKAVKNLHFPENADAYKEAVRRMSFEEIFLFIYLMKRSKEHKGNDEGITIHASDAVDAFIDSLPFTLTDAQKKVISEIRSDMASGNVMNRLIQGDVGSGKTIVALCALMDCAFSGHQGALMAPTEVLAQQHYNTITGLFKDQGIKLNAALLTGSMSALEKRVVYDALEDGRIDIIIGTHAIIQEKVRFKDLALVVTDEQHRFGIKQREALSLKGKGKMPHTIVMSATPIPRTLALIIYGDLDISIIDKAPSSRKPVKNAVVDDSFHENAFRFILRQIREGRQAYVICPLIEYSEGLDAANAEDTSEMLREVMPPDIKIGKLTGSMPPSKKNEIMTKFKNGEIDILVATTVVEVGVDVPNATVMMIEDADRFGLATLHQLRGRVGRGHGQSYCIFVSGSKSKEAIERLEILNHSNDGFEIASKDLEMRGPGEFMGTRQSGALAFKTFDILRDVQIAHIAAEAVDDVIKEKVQMDEHEKNNLRIKSEDTQGRIML